MLEFIVYLFILLVAFMTWIGMELYDIVHYENDMNEFLKRWRN